MTAILSRAIPGHTEWRIPETPSQRDVLYLSVFRLTLLSNNYTTGEVINENTQQ